MKNFKTLILLSFLVVACEKDKGETSPPAGPKAYVSEVFDYQYGPGQHAHLAKFPDWIKGDSTTSDILLGGWGGYVVLGFDHDVINTQGKDIVIYCGMSASPEPGIIYLMDDTNQNGLPDDEWYEVKGSEINHADCIRDYELTYYKPLSAEGNITWEDKFGNTGELVSYSTVPTSRWWWNKDAETVTFSGTRLPEAYYNDPRPGAGQNWLVYPALFRYGYAENGMAANREPADDYSEHLQGNLIDISDAIDEEGNPAGLEKIRFVKIQSGVFQRAGWLEEISTEITGVGDLSMIRNNN